jgi:hypothetical protein
MALKIFHFLALMNPCLASSLVLTIQDLNVAIQNFNYSPEELNDRPQIIEKKSLDTKHVLPMTAVEIKHVHRIMQDTFCYFKFWDFKQYTPPCDSILS